MKKIVNRSYETTIELANTLQQPAAASRIQRIRQYFISQEVFATLQPLFLFTYIYGLTPFRIVKRRNGTSEIRASCFGFCNTAAYVTLYGVCFFNSLLYAESVVGYFLRTNISIVGDTLQICNGIVTGIVIYTTALTQRCKMRRIIEVLNELDLNFANIGVRVKYSRIYRYALVLIVAKILIIAIYCAGVYLLLRSAHVNPSICVCIAFVLQHSVLFLAICLFCFIARGFERRLVILNKVGKVGKKWCVCEYFNYIVKLFKRDLNGKFYANILLKASHKCK